MECYFIATLFYFYSTIESCNIYRGSPPPASQQQNTLPQALYPLIPLSTDENAASSISIVDAAAVNAETISKPSPRRPLNAKGRGRFAVVLNVAIR